MNSDSDPTTVSIAGSDRARIPFAVIGVLLLVSSTIAVATLNSRSDPEPDVDPSVALQQTEAATQTALREAVSLATKRAAEQPITEANDDNNYGERLATISSDDDELFENYLKLRVYLQAERRLSKVGQNVSEVNTTASLAPVRSPDDLENAVENRVEIVDDGRDDGELTIRIRDVEIAAERHGEVIERETESLTVTVATPVFQLHDKVTEYEDQLTAGIDKPGYTQRLNARMYALGWARGYGQYGGLPISEVIANRHVVPSANSAIFATQRDVFGAQDPAAAPAMTQGWACMAMQDAEAMYEQRGGTGSETEGDGINSSSFSADTVCDALSLILGKQTGEDEVESITPADIMSQTSLMNETETIAVNESAYLPFRKMADSGHDYSFGSNIERVFQVEAETETSVTRTDWDDPDHHPGPSGYSFDGTGDLDFEGASLSVDNEQTWTEGSADDEYYQLDATVTATYSQTSYWEETDGNGSTSRTNEGTAEYDVTVVVQESDHSMGTLVPDYGIDTKYEGFLSGTTRVTPGGTTVASHNYEGVPEKAIEELLGDDPENTIESEFSDAASDGPHGVGSEFADELPENTTFDEDDIRPDHVPALEATLAQDLMNIRRDVEDISVTFKRRELITSERDQTPFEELIEKVEAREDHWTDAGGPYATVGEKAVYETRAAYFELLKEDLERVSGAYDDAMGDVNDKMNEETGISNVAEFARSGLSDAAQSETEIRSPELVDNVSYEVSGSPTYLVAENVTKEKVPAVPEDETFAPMAARNANFFSIPYADLAGDILEKINPFADESAKVSLHDAGLSLRSAKLAEDVSGEDISNVGTLESKIESEFDDISASIALQLELRLGVDPGPIETAVRDEIEAQGTSVEERAIELGNGNATQDVADAALAAALDQDGVPPDDYDDTVWETTAESVIVPTVDRTINGAEFEMGVDDIQTLDNETRNMIAEKSGQLVEKRLEDGADRAVQRLERNWLEGNKNVNRVPAGLPITPVPGYWYATMNVWEVDANGEYARFEVSANMGTAAETAGTSYVREDRNVTVDIGGDGIDIGENEAISFEGKSVVAVIVPPGKTGVGDRTGVDPECSESWPHYGEVDGGVADCAGDEE